MCYSGDGAGPMKSAGPKKHIKLVLVGRVSYLIPKAAKPVAHKEWKEGLGMMETGNGEGDLGVPVRCPGFWWLNICFPLSLVILPGPHW